MLDVLKKLLGVGLLLLVLLPVGVLAQDDKPFIIGDEVAVVFPAGVRFSLVLDLAPDDLTRLSLRIEQNGRRLRSGRIDLDDVVLVSEDDVTKLVFFVATVPDSTWRLFEPVVYEWTVTGIDRDDTLEGEFVFEPAGYEWRHDGTAPLEFSLFDENLNVALAGQKVLPAYELMVSHTGLTPEFLWLVQPKGHVYCPAEELEVGEDEVYPCDEERALAFFAQEDYRILERTIAGLLPFQQLLVTALFEEFYGQYWRGADVPGWFSAGLPQYYAVTTDPYILRQVQEQVRVGKLFDWPALASRPGNAEDAAFWEQQSYTLVLYLAYLYGPEAPFALAQAVPGQGFAAALQDLIGDDADLFLLDWERWLFSDEASVAAAWNVHVSATPTAPPSPTLTASPVPATATQTPIITSGILPATFTAIPLNTATPTTSLLLPTATLIPTVTPRPPGSLNQAPAAPPADEESSGPAVCPALLLPLTMLPLAFVATLQRRKRLL